MYVHRRSQRPNGSLSGLPQEGVGLVSLESLLLLELGPLCRANMCSTFFFVQFFIFSAIVTPTPH